MPHNAESYLDEGTMSLVIGAPDGIRTRVTAVKESQLQVIIASMMSESIAPITTLDARERT